ncbi:MAG: hypothetical protein HAW61_05440, partial [Candidatus Portiera sp.]|nr:hypothetical protein [Portiera sp.]
MSNTKLAPKLRFLLLVPLYLFIVSCDNGAVLSEDLAFIQVPMVNITDITVIPDTAGGAFTISWTNLATNNVEIATIIVTATGYDNLTDGSQVGNPVPKSIAYSSNSDTQKVQFTGLDVTRYYEFTFSATLTNGTEIANLGNFTGRVQSEAPPMIIPPLPQPAPMVNITDITIIADAAGGAFNISWTNLATNNVEIANITVIATGYNDPDAGNLEDTQPSIYSYDGHGATQNVTFTGLDVTLFYAFTFSATLTNGTEIANLGNFTGRVQSEAPPMIIPQPPQPAPMVNITDITIIADTAGGTFNISWINLATNNVEIANITVIATGYNDSDAGNLEDTQPSIYSYDGHGATQ